MRHGLFFSFFGLLLVGSSLIHAQVMRVQPGNAAGTITGAGVVVIERQPDLIRMELQLSAEGKDAKEAMSKVKELEAAARKKLADLGASDGSIKVDEVQIGGANNPRQQQMAQMMRQRMGRGGAAKPATQASPPVTATATLQAEWPLKGSAEERAVAAYDLGQKVKAADLSGHKAKPATPEEEEQNEEAMAEMQMQQNGQQMPGEPVFLYISRISDDEQATALAGAFKKAQDQAMHLAKAAGVELGALSSLSSSSTPDIDYDQYGGYGGGAYQRYVYRMMRQLQTGQSEPVTEAVGNNPAKVAIHVTVNAAFAVK